MLKKIIKEMRMYLSLNACTCEHKHTCVCVFVYLWTCVCIFGVITCVYWLSQCVATLKFHLCISEKNLNL